MLIKKRRAWELPESAATPEDIYMNRRQWLKAAGFAGLGLAGSSALSSAAMAAIGGYPFEVASTEVIIDFYRQQGLALETVKAVRPGSQGCNEFVFRRAT